MSEPWVIVCLGRLNGPSLLFLLNSNARRVVGNIWGKILLDIRMCTKHSSEHVCITTHWRWEAPIQSALEEWLLFHREAIALKCPHCHGLWSLSLRDRLGCSAWLGFYSADRRPPLAVPGRLWWAPADPLEQLQSKALHLGHRRWISKQGGQHITGKRLCQIIGLMGCSHFGMVNKVTREGNSNRD